MALFPKPTSPEPRLIPAEAIEDLDWLANFAYFRGYGNYGDAKCHAIVDYFAPALAHAGWPEMETPEMHSFFFRFLSELRDVAVQHGGLFAAGAHLVCYESPECSFSPEIAELRIQITNAAMDYMKSRYDEIEWPHVPCQAQMAFKPS